MVLTEVEYDVIFDYLQHRRYPEEFDKVQERALRQKVNDQHSVRISQGLL